MANLMKPSHSYMDFFLNNQKPETIQDQIATPIKGTCNSMCPDEEIIFRKKERMIHVLEVVGNKEKLVKCYTRPAADTNLAVAHNLRSVQALKETVKYLLFEVTKRTDVSSLVVYNFVTDRLRAVRQDMIIQDFDPELRIALLEPMIRFHVYYGYLLCEAPINDYSPTLNRNMLLECLKTCLYCYDELELRNLDTCNMSFLIKNMNKCSLDKKDQQPEGNRVLVEALYVLTTLYDESPMWRLQRLNENVRHDQAGSICNRFSAPPVRLAYRLAAAALRGHYVSVCKYVPRLCALTFCAVALLLPTLQRRALQVMSAAYSRHPLHVPLDEVRAWTGAADLAAARAAVRHYGVLETGGHVFFKRGTFRDDAPILPPKKITAEHLDGKMNIRYILTYTPCGG